MKIAVTKDNVFNRKPYRSILNLLIEYQYYKGGLEQKHFRYALIKNHDKNNFHEWTYIEMQSFFKDRLQSMFKQGLIDEGCITSRNSLNNFLTALCNLKAITRAKKGKKTKYTISKEYKLLGERIFNRQVFDWYKHLKVIEEPGGIKHYIYGLGEELYESMSKKDRNKLQEHIENITSNLFNIDSIVKRTIYIHLRDELIKTKFSFKQEFPEYIKFHQFIDKLYLFVPMLIFMDVFELTPKREDKEPTGYPFDIVKLDKNISKEESDRIYSKHLFELFHNLIYHRDELFKLLKIPIEVGNRYFDSMKQISKEFKQIYDWNMISYSYLTKGLPDEEDLHHVISGELLE
jgi:hypothetical protein